MIKRIVLKLVIMCGIALPAIGQSVSEGFELQEIIRMSDAYRRLPYLSYNATYQYADSATPLVITEQINAQYKINEGKYWAMLDSTELVQGNNYKLAVYHDQKFLTIGRPDATYASVTQLPFLDSLFGKTFVDSMHVTELNDSTRKLAVDFKEGAFFSYYEVFYHPVTYMVYSIKYYQKDVDPEVGSSGTNVISITFSNYSNAVIDEEYFRESKFITKDGSTFQPKAPYNDFEVLATSEF